MFSKNPLFFLFIGLILLSIGCEETSSPTNPLNNAPVVNSLSLSPPSVQFTSDDNFKDTTVVLTLEAQIDNTDEDSDIGYIVRDKNSLFILGIGTLSNLNNVFSNQIQFLTNTTSFENYTIEVYAYDKDGNGNYYQAPFTITGVSNDPPILLEVNNPEEVQIPNSGDVVVPFTAKVFDPDGQQNIDRVVIEFINEDGSSLIPSPNQLLDNGLNEDVAAGDSVYTIAFTINPQNTPNNRTAIYFAIDKAGLHSDTLQTTFNIVEQ